MTKFAALELTEKTTGRKIVLTEDRLIKVFPEDSGNDAKIIYDVKGALPAEITVDDTVASILAGYSSMITLTDVTVGTIYLSSLRFVEITADGSGSKVTYDRKDYANGAEHEYISVTETPTAVTALINA